MPNRKPKKRAKVATSPGPSRRRGEVLEAAILDAAWDELATVGYTNLTVDAVARRAGTSRAVLYRRWPTKAGLSAGAIARHTRQNPIVVPDLGKLRDELRYLMRKFADQAPPRLLKLVFEMSEDMATENMSFLDTRFQTNPMQEPIRRGIDRGEIDSSRLSPRVLRLPLSLVLHDTIITGRRISDEAIEQIVDQVFLPLVQPHGTPPPSASG